jgi:ribose/xylose/arabinose/galactoside ABC-type transport system permease subunit
MPPALVNFFYTNPIGLPMVLWVVVIVLVLWYLLRSTRYGPYLYATGGRDLSAFVSGVPVSSVRFLSYCIAGLMAALAALALALSTGTPSSWQTLINGRIVVAALAGPGLVALLGRGRRV